MIDRNVFKSRVNSSVEGKLGSAGGIFLSQFESSLGGCPSIKDFSFEISENIVTIEATLNIT